MGKRPCGELSGGELSRGNCPGGNLPKTLVSHFVRTSEA